MASKKYNYVARTGWFDLSKLHLPELKLKAYGHLQELGEHYQKTYDYQKQFNNIQLIQLKELCAEMALDLITNYNALEKG